MSHSSEKQVAVLGFHDGNAGQVSEWFESVSGYKIACFVVEAPEPKIIDPIAENKKRVSQKMEYPGIDSFKGRPLIWSLDWVHELKRRNITKVLPLTSDNRERWNQIQRANEAGFQLVSAIHPTAIILDQAELSSGLWINARSVIGYKAELAPGTMINTGVIIEHHNVLDSCVQVDPGAITAGNVTLRARCHIHMGAIVVNKVEIGEDAEVGAGSLVRHNIPASTVVVGIPARHLRMINYSAT